MTSSKNTTEITNSEDLLDVRGIIARVEAGPWTINRGHGWFAIADQHQNVCHMPEPVDAQVEANARLIAAAPDLYAALKDLNEEVRAILDSMREHGDDELESAYQRAFSALALVNAQEVP